MDLLEQYKELYYKEIEHSERLNNKINVCITFLTILGSAQILLWTQFKKFSFSWYSLLYLIFCFVSFILFVCCLYHFYHTYSGYSYRYFPIREMALKTQETYYIAGNNEEDKALASQHIYNMYCERFLNDAIANMKCNETKNNKHKKLTSFICWSFIITIITFAISVIIDYYETQFINSNIEHIIIDGGIINVR